MRNKKRSERYDKYKDVVTGMEHHKIPALGMLERNGQIKVMLLTKAAGKEIKPILKSNISKNSEIITDGFGGYKGLNEYFAKHETLNKSKNQHRKGNYHLNTIEGFWSLLKRSIIGQYHKISKTHLQKYIDELTFKYNYRNCNLFEVLISNMLKLNYT